MPERGRVAIRTNYSSDPVIARLQRKRDQAWELAGEARQQQDKQAEAKYMAEAEKYKAQIRELSL